MTPTVLPSRKVSAAAIAASAVTLLVFLLNGYVPAFLAKPISAEVASTAITLITSLVAYFTPPGATEGIVTTSSGGTTTARQ